jgi:hypothetical protein
MSAGHVSWMAHDAPQSLSGVGLLHPAPNVAAWRCDSLEPPSARRARNDPEVLGLQLTVQYWTGYVKQALVGSDTSKV